MMHMHGHICLSAIIWGKFADTVQIEMLDGLD